MLANRFLVIAGEPARAPGSAVIKKAFDIKSGQFVAIKFLSAANDAVLNKLFKREVANLRAFKHPNIVRLVDSGVDDSDTPYLVLEWVERNLADVFKERPDMEWGEFYADIFRPLVEAVAHVHLAQREHRDVKPQNVLVDDVGRIVLADFGIGKSRGGDATTSATVQQFRSGIYAPPELSEKRLYVRDVYSLGVVAIQAMTLKNLNDYAELDSAASAIDVPEQVRALLKRCIEFDPFSRPANAAVLLSLVNEAERAANASAMAEKIGFLFC
jgi:serine/threonine protein kinase